MLTRSSSLVAAVISVALLSAVTRTAHADCKNDAECKGDRVCEKGVCVAAPATAPAPATATAPGSGAASGSASVAGGVEVHLTGRENTPVSLDGTGGRGSCRSPCTVTVPPGRYTLRSGGLIEEVDIPSHPTDVEMKSGCKGCVIGGAIGAGVGLGLLVTGLVLKGKARESCETVNSSPSNATDSDFAECYPGGVFTPGNSWLKPGNKSVESNGGILLGVGIGLLVASGALLITGIAIGGAKATVLEPGARASAEPNRLRVSFTGDGAAIAF